MEIKVRKWQASDASALYELGKDPSLRTYWLFPCPYPNTMPRAVTCICFLRQANPLRYCIGAIEADYQVCGYMLCEQKGHGCAELTYWLGKSFRKQGIMKAAVAHMLPYIYAHMDVTTIYARVRMEHIASQKILLSHNFMECKDTAPIYLYYYHNL